MDWPTTIASAGKLFREKSLSSETLTRQYLLGIAKLQPKLNAFITVLNESAIEEARNRDIELEMGTDRGPLHGVPIVIKDDIDVAGVRCTFGSEIHRNRIASSDATVVTNLKLAGAVILGKTNLNEFAAGGRGGFNTYFGDTRNPWSILHEPGGSSSGSGVAVAAGLCLGALGTDSGGSIRGPAARCGVVGFRPTQNFVSTKGVFPRCPSFGTVGPLTRSVADSALIFNSITAPRTSDTSPRIPREDFTRYLGLDISGRRLGLIADFSLHDLADEVENAISEASSIFTNLGASIEIIDVPPFHTAPNPAQMARVIFYEFSQTIGDDYTTYDKKYFGQIVHSDMQKGSLISSQTHNEYLAEKKFHQAEIKKYFSEVDAFLTPTFPNLHMRCDEQPNLSGELRRFTIPMSYFGLPVISLPCSFTDKGLPIGLQIVGCPGQDALIFGLAEAFEDAANFFEQRPPDSWT